MEIEIPKETIDVLKKEPGTNKTPSSNREKAVIVDALKGNIHCRYCLESSASPKVAIITRSIALVLL